MRIQPSLATRLASMPQKADFYLFAQTGNYIWTGRVDAIVTVGVGWNIYFTTLSGDRTRVLRNMSAWFGTDTLPKLRGHVRIVDTANMVNNSFVTIAANSMSIAVGDVISVDCVPRLYAIDSYHDYGDIVGSPTNLPPFSNMGPHRAVWTGEQAFFWADHSWAQRGRTITSHSWNFGPNSFVSYPGNNPATSGSEFLPITARWYNAGDYVVSHTVLDSAGQQHTSWRVVIVRDQPNTPEAHNTPYQKFTVGNVTGDYDDGGWTAQLNVWEQADKTNFPDNGVVILRAVDYYQDQVIETGGYPLHSDYVFVGYTQHSTSGMDGDANQSVNLTVSTAHNFAKELTVWPANFAPASSPNSHHNIDKVTLWEVIHHLATEHSNLGTHNDLLYYDTDRRVDYLDLTESNLWDQIGQQVASARMAFPVCNRYGQIFVARDANHRNQRQRALYGPVEFTFDNSYWTNITLGDNRARDVVAQVDAIGVYICTLNAASSTNISGVYALWPPLQSSYGTVDKLEGILIPTTSLSNAQGEIQEWAQLRYYRSNIRFPLVTIKTFNIRAFDPAEQNYVGVTLAVEDTLEGWSWSAKEFIVRHAEYEINTEDGYLLVSYGLEDSIWGNDGQAGEYPPGATGPDYTPIVTGRGYSQREGKSVLACWNHGIVECRDVFTAPQNWEDRTGNLVSKLDRAGNSKPRMSGVERDPYSPTSRWWAWGGFGIAKTTDRGSNWTVVFNANTMQYYAAQAGYNLSADELSQFTVIRHKSPFQPLGWHAALMITRYPGQVGRARLWYVATNNNWEGITAFRLITDWLTNPGEYNGPNLAHMDMHQWPTLNPYGQQIVWITTGLAERQTVQLWQSIDGGRNWRRVIQGTTYGYEGVWPDRIVVPTSGNDTGDIAWWVGSGTQDQGTTWIKITNATTAIPSQIVLTRQFTTAIDGPTFGVGFDPPFAVYPQAADYFHSVGYMAQNACWSHEGTGAPWRRMSAPPGPYQGFAQWPYDFNIMYIGTNEFAFNLSNFAMQGLFYYTRDGGAGWVDATSNLTQLIAYNNITRHSPLWSLSPDWSL
jgi:hypothetical protein